jgi:hypothetical protein
MLTVLRPDHKINYEAELAALPYCPLVQRLGHLPLEQAIGVRIPGGQPDSSQNTGAHRTRAENLTIPSN